MNIFNLQFSVALDLFEKSLLKIAKTEEIIDETTTPYGTKYILEGKLDNPIGKLVKVRTLWIIEIDQNRPRFVTVYPV